MYKSILVVDDDLEILDASRAELGTTGFKVFTARNGKEALEIVHNNHLDLIATDLIMPVMDGYNFYRSLQEDKQTKDIPVIVLAEAGTTAEGLSGIDEKHFLVKPFDFTSLINKIEILINKPESRKQLQRIFLLAKDKLAATTTCSDINKYFLELEFYVDDKADSLLKCRQFPPDAILLELPIQEEELLTTFTYLRQIALGNKIRILTYCNSDTQHHNSIVHQQHSLIKRGFEPLKPVHFLGSLNKTSLVLFLYEFC